MRDVVRKLPGAPGMYHAAKRLTSTLSSRKTISDYLASNAVRKLHIGCGGNPLTGWLNSDYQPTSSSVIHLNARKRFPFDNNTLDYIFSEHMIEHVSYADGRQMLKECNRVLRTNGRIRISTPDLQFLIDLYSEQKTTLQEDYIKWASDAFVKNGECSDTMVINNFVRDWGHLFIYDEKTLRRSLELSGFVDVIRYKIRESGDRNLRNLENETRMPAGFLQLESLTLEARKP